MMINTIKGGYFYLLAAIAAVLLITAGWAQTASVEPTAEAEVLKIATAEELAAFRDRVNSGEVSLDAKLTADIDMGGSHWKPIGEKILSEDFSAEQPTTTANCAYAGVFDGAGHAVTNFTVDSKDAVVVSAFPDQHGIYTAAALFGIVDSGGTVKNLTVSADVTNESYKAGANNIIVLTGGIIGYNSGTVANCTSSGTVTPNGQYSMAGGISGFNDGGTITNCTNSGKITVDGDLSQGGGIVGQASGTVTGCTNNGDVTATSQGGSSGGIAGSANPGVTISNCTNSGAVAGITAGGIAGNTGATISNCANSGKVTANGTYSFVGGIAAYNGGKINNCTNSGVVTANPTDSCVGGIAGINDPYGTITNCGFLADAALPAIGTGKTAYPEVVAVVSLDITAYNQTTVAAALSDDIAGTAITMETGESFVVKTKLLPGTNIASPENYYEITSANVTDDVASAAITSTDVTVKALTAGNSQLTLRLKLKATDFEKAAAGSFEPISGDALEVTFTAPITVTPPTAGSSGCNAGIPALALLFLASFALMRRKC
ncbi:MAG: GLUG motif-containing protein [Cloacibacillus sp.]